MMPNFKNIHWRGCPGRHFPCFRVASSHSGSFHSTAAHIAAQDAFRRPLSAAIQHVRSEQRFKARRRRRGTRSSLSSSNALRARRRLSRKAWQNIQVLGCNSSRERDARTESIQTLSPPNTHSLELQWSIDGTSDRTNSLLRNKANPYSKPTAKGIKLVNPDARHNIYSLKQVADDRVRQTKADENTFARPNQEVDAHLGPIETASGGNNNYNHKGTDTYDPRIPVKKATFQPRKRASGHVSPLSSRRVSDASKLPGPQKIEAPANTAINPDEKVVMPEVASRILKERRDLRRYAKELELYIQATKALPEGILVPSSTITPASNMSVHTVQELMPYRDQFEAAGLAVSSADQRKKTRLRRKSSFPPPPPTPLKDRKFRQKRTASKQSRTVRNNQDESKSKWESVTASTADGATDKKATPPSPTPQITPTRKSLPWLRKSNGLPKVVSPAKTSMSPEKQDGISRSTSPIYSSSSSTIVEFSRSPSKSTGDAKKIDQKAHSETEDKQKDTNHLKEDRASCGSITDWQPRKDQSVQTDSQKIASGIGTIEGRTIHAPTRQPPSPPDFPDGYKRVYESKQAATEAVPMSNSMRPNHYLDLMTQNELERFRQCKAMVDMIVESFGQAPVGDPMKKPAQPYRPEPRQNTVQFPRHYSTMRTLQLRQFSRQARLQSLPQIPVFLGSSISPSFQSKIESPKSTSELDWIDDLDTEKFSSTDIIRGLYVATAAAWNEEIDKQIKEITGIGVRKFIADLGSLEGLCTPALRKIKNSGIHNSEIERDSGTEKESCLPGERELPGQQGEPSERGLAGERGLQGPRGFQYEMGMPGPRGVQGGRGQLGPRGEQGPRGIQEEKGLQGERGPRGTVGLTSESGPSGQQGIQGPQGERGPRGLQGEQGGRGEKGEDGCDSVVYVVDERHRHARHLDQKMSFETSDQPERLYVPTQHYGWCKDGESREVLSGTE